MRSRALWVQKKVCKHCCRRPSQAHKARLKTSKSTQKQVKRGMTGFFDWSARNCLRVFPNLSASPCASAIVGLVACSALFAAPIAILALTKFQAKVVNDTFEFDFEDVDKVDRQSYFKKNIIAKEMENNTLLALAAAFVPLIVAYYFTCDIVHSLTSVSVEARPTANSAVHSLTSVSVEARPTANLGIGLLSKILAHAAISLYSLLILVFTILWAGMLAACSLYYRMDNFNSCLEGAVKDSTPDIVRKCCESALINSTSVMNWSGMMAAFTNTTQAFSNATSTNSTAAMPCACDVMVAGEICINYLKPLLHPYVQPLLLLSIVHILLLAAFCSCFDSNMVYVYMLMYICFFPPKPISKYWGGAGGAWDPPNSEIFKIVEKSDTCRKFGYFVSLPRRSFFSGWALHIGSTCKALEWRNQNYGSGGAQIE